MKQMITYRQAFIRDCSEQNENFKALFNIFKLTLKPDMQFREFKVYYCSAKLVYIDVTFVLSNQTIIGFCAAAFYTTLINNKLHTIGRAATGIMEQYRGNTLPKWKLYKKYIAYWRRHPFRNFILTAYVANPLIYAMICKYTGVAYPKMSSDAPPKIIDIKNELLRSQHLQAKENQPFVVEIHFCVALSDQEQDRIFKSRDGAVKYFLKINPKFRQQYGVLVIIPVNMKNILLSAYKFLYHKNAKIFLEIMRWIKKPVMLLEEKINFT
jgi:hypothetical protein